MFRFLHHKVYTEDSSKDWISITNLRRSLLHVQLMFQLYSGQSCGLIFYPYFSLLVCSGKKNANAEEYVLKILCFNPECETWWKKKPWNMSNSECYSLGIYWWLVSSLFRLFPPNYKSLPSSSNLCRVFKTRELFEVSFRFQACGLYALTNQSFGGERPLLTYRYSSLSPTKSTNDKVRVELQL